MQSVHRRSVPAIIALLVALALVPIAPDGVAAADSYYAAACTARLRQTPSTSGTSIISMPTGTVVTTTGTVIGDAWTATCTSSVSGSAWYAITAVGGTSVQTLYGVSVAYAATGLFQPSAAPPTPTIYLEGIDVSHYQGAIDWTQVPGSGRRFVVIQATVGETYVDPTYATNHAGARAVGLPIAAYHFAWPLDLPNDAVIQADWFAQNAALLPGDLIPALDLEQTGGLSTAALQAWVGAWLGEVYAKLGIRPMIYTSPSFWANSMGDTSMFADQGFSVLWVAHWFTSSPTVTGNNWGGHGWTFWQYSNCGTVAGISGCVDLDRYNGSDLTGMSFNYLPLPPVAPPVLPPNAAPILAGVAPATVAAGGGDLNLAIQGADFAAGISTAYWNGTALVTTYVSPTALTAVVPAALTGTPGTGSVTVLNQPPGGGTSTPVTFSITLPAAQLSVKPSTAVAAWGQTVTLDVQIATSGQKRTVTLQRMQANETQWSDIGRLTTDVSGHASMQYRPPVNTQFQAVYAGDPDLGPATSPAVRVVIRQLVVLRPTNLGHVTNVTAGSSVTFTATVRPIGPTLAPAKVTFQVWRLVSGHWVSVAKRDAAADPSGRASTTWRFSLRGQWYVRAVADPTLTNANSTWSPVERYSVQ